jgi:hypothetical protein
VLSACAVAHAAPGAVNLTVQLREVGDASGHSVDSGVTVSTLGADPASTQVLSLQVLNGTRATLQIDHSTPFVWVQAAQGRPGRRGAGASEAAARGGAVANERAWMHTGRSVAITPHWPGGRLPVAVDIDFDSASATPSATGDPPDAQRQRVHTTVSVPLGLWVTFAQTGSEPEAPSTTWSTDRGPDRAPRWLQIQVLAP